MEKEKLLTWKINSLNMKIQKRIQELDALILEREKTEEELARLNNVGYATQ